MTTAIPLLDRIALHRAYPRQAQLPGLDHFKRGAGLHRYRAEIKKQIARRGIDRAGRPVENPGENPADNFLRYLSP